MNLAKKVRETVVNISAAAQSPVSGTLKSKNSGNPDSQAEPPWLQKYLAKSDQQTTGATHRNGGEASQPPASYGDRNERGGTPYRSLGSGVVLSANGYILTDDHAVFRLNRINVRFSNGRVKPARLVGADRTTDLALLKVNAHGLLAARSADDRAPEVGEWTLSVGLPRQSGEAVAAGIVSAVHRVFGSKPYVPFIQTDAISAVGDFGGPLFDMRGRLIGIVSPPPQDAGKRAGQTFAVPIGLAMKVVHDLKATGKVTRGWLGVVVQGVTPDLAQSFGMSIPHGALVTRVMRDSPAAQSGLQPGDVILAFNGEVLRSSGDLPPLVGTSEPGQTVNLRLLRNGKIVTLRVELGSLAQFGSESRPLHENEPSTPRSVASPNASLGLSFEPAGPGEQAKGMPRFLEAMNGRVVEPSQGTVAGLHSAMIPLYSGGGARLSTGFYGTANCPMTAHESWGPSQFAVPLYS